MSSDVAFAGSRGPNIRDDCWVELKPGAGAIRIKSRVLALYGASIRRLAEEVMARLGVTGVDVVIDDSGALPFTLMARIETAVRRFCGAALPEVLPEIHPAACYAVSRHRRRRSRLYLPGNVPKFFINAGLYRPGAVILDLEDSVPEGEKDAARVLVRNALRAVDFYGAEKMVRINSLPLGLEDARALAPHGAHTFVIPKVESPDDVAAVDRVTRETGRQIHLVPLIESARGALHAASIAQATPSVVALGLGLEDYLKDIGAQRTAERNESLWVAGLIVNAARAAGIQPLASVYSAVDDLDGLARYAREARASGFEGIGCIHPRQVRAANAAFTPTVDEIEQARRIITEFEKAEAAGAGTVAVDGRMVDRPIVERAYRTLEQAQNT